MAEVKMRFNPDAGEVELVVDGEVALASGREEFQSWVAYENEQNPPAAPEPTEEEKLQARVEELENQLAVANAAAETVESVITPDETTVETPTEE
jgi:hypothetical protein